MPQIDAITQYILAIVPAVTALMGMIVLVGVGIGKIKAANRDTASKIEDMSRGQKALKDANNELRKENIELKKALIELNKKIDIIDTIKAVEKE